MKKEDLARVMGLTEKQITAVIAISAEELKRYIPKTRFDEVNKAKKQLEQQIVYRDTQLTELNKRVNVNEELEKIIKNLNDANATTKTEYETKLKDITINYAIQAKLVDVKYADLLKCKFDRTKLSVTADGTVDGIDEQLTTIKGTYKDLFLPTVTVKQSNSIGGSHPPKGKRQELDSNYVNYYHRIVNRYGKTVGWVKISQF